MRNNPQYQIAEFLLHRGKHNEHLVNYFSRDWDSLSNTLLINPREYLEFEYKNNWDHYWREPEWRFHRDVVANFYNGFGSSGKLRKACGLLNPAVPVQSERQLVDMGALSKESIEMREMSLGVLEQLDLFKANRWLRDVIEYVWGGAYYAEFAVDTHTLLITHYPPVIGLIRLWNDLYPEQFPNGLTDVAKACEANPPRYKGGFSTGTLACSQTAYGIPMTTFHFDLDNNPQAKADFIVGHLECPTSSHDLINGHFSKPGTWEKYQSTFSSPRGPVADAVSCDASCWCPITPKSGSWLDEKPMDPNAAFILAASAMPGMSVEGLSADDDSDPCTQWELVCDPVTGVCVEELVTVKSY